MTDNIDTDYVNKMPDRYIFYFFLALLVWLPLPLGSNRIWSEMLMVILVALLFISWCFLFMFGGVKLTHCFKKAAVATTLLTLSQLFIGYQLYNNFTIDANSSFRELLQGISLTLFFMLCLLLINSTQRIKITILVIIASGLFQAVYGSLMTLSGVEYTFFVKKVSYIGVATGTFINRNHLAGYLVICLSLGLGMMIASLKADTKSWRGLIRQIFEAILSQKAILRISLVIIVAALVMTHSRMGNSSFFASMGIVGTVAILLKKRSVGSTIVLLLSLLIIDVAVVGTFFGVGKVIDRLEKTSAKSESRDEVNLYSIKLVKDNLLTGTGAGTFYNSFPQVREKEVGFLFYDHAHNDYIEFLTERGVIGIVPLVLLVVITFLTALAALWKRQQSLMRGCAFGCLMSMLAMAIHATVDFNLQIPANAATFMLVLALGWIGMFHRPKRKRRAEESRDPKDNSCQIRKT
mgnify:CR=1 FL=1